MIHLNIILAYQVKEVVIFKMAMQNLVRFIFIKANIRIHSIIITTSLH